MKTLPKLKADGRHAKNAETGAIVFAGQLEQKSYVEACDQIFDAVRACNSHAALVAALDSVVNSGPLNNGLRDENTMALARAALKSAQP